MARPRSAPAVVVSPTEGAELKPVNGNGALTAAAERATDKRAEKYIRLHQAWQAVAMDYYDTVGEAWYAAQFYARAMSNLRLFAGRINDQGEVEEIKAGARSTPKEGEEKPGQEQPAAKAKEQPTDGALNAAAGDVDEATATDEQPAVPVEQEMATTGTAKQDPAVLALERIQDRSGGRSQLLAAWGRLMFLTGEGYLTVTMDEDADEETWEFLSSEELRVNPGGGYVRYMAPSMPQEQLDSVGDEQFEPIEGRGKNKTAVVYRMWKRHPRFSSLADSPMKAVLDLFEELKLLEKAVRARARSRLAAAGILVIPQELTFGVTQTGGTDPEGKNDPVMKRLQQAMTTAIQTPGAASGVVPIVIRGPYEYLDRIAHIKIDPGDESYPEADKQETLIGRIAIGLDMPKEVLTGMSDANHWSAWQIDDQTWRAHLEPMARMLVDDLTSTYLRPYLKKQNVQDWDRYVVGFDEAGVVSHPDKAKDAKELHAAGAIGYKALRDANAFTDDDEMDKDEYHTWLAIQFNDASMLPGELGDQVRKAKEEQAQKDLEAQLAVAETKGKPGEEEEGPPVEKSAGEKQEQGNKQGARPTALAASAAELMGAARATHRRAREMAGNRLRTKVRKNERLESLIASASPAEVALTIGHDRCTEAGLGSAEQLVAGAGASFTSLAVQDFGLDEAVARRVGLLIESHAAKTLWDAVPEPLPAQLGPYLERVL